MYTNKKLLLAIMVMFSIPALSFASYTDRSKPRTKFVESFLEQDSDWDTSEAEVFADRILNTIKSKNFSLTEENIEDISYGIKNLSNFWPVNNTTHPITKKLLGERIDYIICNYYNILDDSADKERTTLYDQYSGMLDKLSDALKNKYSEKSDMLEIIDSIIVQAKSNTKKMCNNRLRNNFKKPMSDTTSQELLQSWINKFDILEDMPYSTRKEKFMFECKAMSIITRAMYKASKETSIEKLPMPLALIEAENEYTDKHDLIFKWEDEKRQERTERKREQVKAMSEIKASTSIITKRALLELGDSVYELPEKGNEQNVNSSIAALRPGNILEPNKIKSSLNQTERTQRIAEPKVSESIPVRNRLGIIIGITAILFVIAIVGIALYRKGTK